MTESEPTMPDERVLVSVDGAVATLTLNRPAKLNAIDPSMLDALEHAVGRIATDAAVRVVLLTGAGERAFSVGADITAWSALTPLEMGRWWIRRGHQVFDGLSCLRQPVIAVLNGYTFGGGLELALAADLRLAAEGVELALPEVKLGTIPGWGGTQRLPAPIGAARAKAMIFTGARIPAATAEQWGLLNEVVPRGTLFERAHALAQEIAGNAPLSVQFAKQLVDGGGGHAPGTTLEALAGALAATTDDGREGLAAYRERRAPQFGGR
ncbi:MAG: enoyl-CoA hydratase/isomerase family protein [Chloroflexota bacterium]